MDKTAERTILREFTERLRARGFVAKTIVSDEEMALATEGVPRR